MPPLSEYIKFLEQLQESLVEEAGTKDLSKLNGDEWEEKVFEHCQRLAKKLELDWGLLKTKSAEVPDIILNETFGIEVKSTKEDHWTTLGNSIVESTRVPGVEEIYVLFGKLGGKVEVLFKEYEKCLKNIQTTHYPRYVIDMKLEKGTSIFERMGMTYSQYVLLDKDERIRLIKDFLRSMLAADESLWWIDEATFPVIKNFNRFDMATKRDFTIEAMARFPEIFEQKRGKYDRIAQLLLTKFQAVSGNLRDHFSASGQVAIRVSNGDIIKVPQMVYLLHINANEIRKIILASSNEDLAVSWEVTSVPLDRIGFYQQILNNSGYFESGSWRTGDLFVDGLQN